MTLLPLCNMHIGISVCCMAATGHRNADATAATGSGINFELFDLKCAERGALDEESRAALAVVDRVTLWRWRGGKVRPSLSNLMHIARTLEVTLDELTTRRAA